MSFVALPNAPAIPGLRFRSIERPADDARMADLINTASTADGVPRHETAARISLWLDHPSGIDPARDFLFAEADGQLVAYAGCGWEQDNDGGRNYQTHGQVLPAWRRRGLGSALLRWSEDRQRAVAASHPPATERRLDSWAYDSEVGRRALLEANGYATIRYWFEMRRPTLDDLPEIPAPAGVDLRAARAEDVRRVWELEVAAFRDHWGSIDDSEASFERRRDNPLNNLSLWVVAWHGDEVVGEVINRIDPAENEQLGLKRGWLGSVAVRRDWRHKGVARAMVAASLRGLRHAGMTSAGLGVDADNPHGAVGIYESTGFEIALRGRVYRKPF
jgi:mycothiol synthase